MILIPKKYQERLGGTKIAEEKNGSWKYCEELSEGWIVGKSKTIHANNKKEFISLLRSSRRDEFEQKQEDLLYLKKFINISIIDICKKLNIKKNNFYAGKASCSSTHQVVEELKKQIKELK